MAFRFDEQKALWKQWKDSGDEDVKETLFESLQPLVRSQVNKYKNAPISPTAIESEAWRLTDQALHTYKPEKAALGTHVRNYLNKLYRYVGKYQNIGRIPEHKIMQIRSFTDARDKLKEDLQRDPYPEEIADMSAIPLSQVKDLMKMLKSDFSLIEDMPTGTGAGEYHKDLSAHDILTMARFELDPEDRQIFDLLYQGEDPEAIARKYNKSVRWVNKRRKAISEIIKGKIGML